MENAVCPDPDNSSRLVDSQALLHLQETLFTGLLKSHVSKLFMESEKKFSVAGKTRVIYTGRDLPQGLFAHGFNPYVDSTILFAAERRGASCMFDRSESDDFDFMSLETDRMIYETVATPVCSLERGMDAVRSGRDSKPLLILNDYENDPVANLTKKVKLLIYGAQ